MTKISVLMSDFSLLLFFALCYTFCIMKNFDTIIVGAGAAGLYCACNLDGGENLILEKGKRPGLKLLMAGGGQCNVTHGGSIKDFLTHYGDHGKSIRTALQKHNNIELCAFLAELGVPTIEREDGKIFPKSMDARDVLNALLDNINCEIKYESEVSRIIPFDAINQDVVHSSLEFNSEQDSQNDIVNDVVSHHFEVVLNSGETYQCNRLVIATGGASYPTTGSDGKLAQRLSGDLNIELEALKPALTPVYVENYRYGDLSGISFKDVQITVDGNKFEGDLLLTLKNFSGPVIINSSRNMNPGDKLQINYLWNGGKGYKTTQDLATKLKKDFPGNSKLPVNYFTENLDLPKRFITAVCDELAVSNKKVSQLSGAEITALAASFTAQSFVISGVAGFKEAMATAGGIKLSEISTKTMESKSFPRLYFIGEVLDVDGDTGGYNLQFAYSSARVAADNINQI